jgi:c-di-GMP-binding flagellar brake protein YcgR
MNKTKLTCCSITGIGKILRDGGHSVDFEIVDLCSEGAKIHTTDDIETGTQLKIEIVLPAILFQVEINTDAVIVKKGNTEDGFLYGLEFIGLSERDRREIDEIVVNTCGVF